ncbi:MAG: hypothetical protein ABL882_03870 [Sphingopyxis sp.]
MYRFVPFAALAAALFTVPAAAQQHPGDDAPRVLRQLQNPRNAEALGTLAEALARTLMNIKVGPLADAMRSVDPDSELANVPEDATLGDLAHVDARDAARLGDDAHAVGNMVAGVSRQLEVMLPTLTAMARDMSAQWERDWDQARRQSRNRR